MKFYHLHRTNDDDCAQNSRERQNGSINDYNTFNYIKNDCSNNQEKERLDFLAENPNLRMKYGYGNADKCTVDNDSRLRNDSMLTQTKCRNQLFERQYTGIPNLARGVLHPNVESRLRSGEDTGQKRSCNVLSEVYIDRFTPFVPCLKEQIQNDEHIIPEWTWGGAHSRHEVRDADYLERCGYKHDGKTWQRADNDQVFPQNGGKKNAKNLHDKQRDNYRME